jgi:ABC-2 type transport system permease protein
MAGQVNTVILTPARMRASMFQRSLREHPGPAVAGLCGLLAAAWLIRYGLYGDQHTLSILAGTWVLGWIVLPLMLGGGRGRVRPSHLRLEPVGSLPAAAGLLAASAVGIGPLVSLVALASLPVHAARYGPRGLAVAGLGALLLWLIGLIGSAFALEAIGHAGGPVGAIVTGLFTGTVMGVLGSVWAVAPWITRLLSGTPEHIVRWLPWFPGSWPLSAATGPAGRGLWMVAGLFALVGMFALAYVALVRRTLVTGTSWRPRRAPAASSLTAAAAPSPAVAAASSAAAGSLTAATTSPAASSPTAGSSPSSDSLPGGGSSPAGGSSPGADSLSGAGPSAGAGPSPASRRVPGGWWGPGPVWAVAGRELRTWIRHPLRLQYLAFAIVYGALLAGLPMLADAEVLVPWAGALTALWAAAMSAGLVGLDGTALWLPFTTPGGERAEVRGRALAWLLLVTPVAVLLTVAGVLVAPAIDPLPAIAVLPAVLGAGATVPVWVSLLRVRPVPDPRHPTSADNPTDIISVLVASGAGLLAAAAPLALLVWGPDELRWLAPLLGLATGAAAWFGGAWLADDRLASRGAEVLTAAGRRTRAPETAIPLKWDPDWYRENRATAWALILLTAGWIPVIPQGLMVLVFDISGGWIVASHFAGSARTGTALAMVALGGAMLLTGLVLWGRRPQPTVTITTSATT